MSLQKKPALRRNYSEERLPRSKDCSLPTLIKGQDYTASPLKRYNLEPFKLRVNNAQDKAERTDKQEKPEKREEKPQDSPLRLTRPERPPSPEITPITPKSPSETNNNTTIQNIFEPFLKETPKEPRARLTKRSTMAYGDFQSWKSSEAASESGSDEEGDRRGTFKRVSRKFSFTTIPSTNATELREVGVAEKRSNFCNRESKKQIQKVLFYHQFLRQQAELHDLELTSVNSYDSQRIHYSLGPGNNRQLLRECMGRRWWWQEDEKAKVTANLLWTQLKDRHYIASSSNRHSSESDEEEGEERPSEEVSDRRLHNHFECNKYLGSKVGLYLSLKAHCSRNGTQLGDVLLPTFYVRRFMDEEWKNFTKAYFERLEVSRIDNWDVSINKKYWLVRAVGAGITNNHSGSELSRGSRIFTTYKEIKQHVERNCKNGVSFLIQKYLSRPFLFKRRKFDLRVYALLVRLNRRLNVYLHRQGVVSTATEHFDMLQIDNPLAHFTTEAVQITSKKFGEYEPGNKIDFTSFQAYLDAAHGDAHSLATHAFPLMQQAVAQFAAANAHRIARTSGSCFELLQCEFTMDEDFRPWLVDVHTNPPLETYCLALERTLPAVIEDVLRHTADVLFPPPLEWPDSKHHLLAHANRPDGFVLVFEQGKTQQLEESDEEDEEGVASDRDMYVDDLLEDTEDQPAQSGLEYLLSEVGDFE